ncbi:hypothetical protein BKA62DRAFT_684984 [Auriculariales sp. MPI-PUGE-AT-0066]|nr:hypothetical protein BKA62DRAFT_684984 [Auriculariales sp. MPI-PUGE-AT-0066]
MASSSRTPDGTMSPGGGTGEEGPSWYKHLGPADHIIFREDSEEDLFLARPRKWRDLVRPFVVRQWLLEGKIHRERSERQQSRYELFFDLVFVAFAHHLSDAAAESANGSNLLRFILTFYPAWSLWSEFRTFMNQSGTDDVVTRVTVLFLMAALVGYSANASAINFDFGHTSEEGSAVAAGEASNATEAAPEAAQAVGEAVHELIRRAATGEGGEEHPVDGRLALVASAAFFMVGRGLRLPMIILYAWSLPQFSHAFRAQGLLHLTVLLLVMPCLWVKSANTVIALTIVAIFVDVFGRFIPALFLYTTQFYLRRAQRKSRDIEAAEGAVPPPGEKNSFFYATRPYPALNIEHHIERTVSFIIIVLGEIVISVVYQVTGTSLGLSMMYFRAVLGLIIAFNVAAIYFDMSGTGLSVHPLRRHWFSAVFWDQLHWPLSCALILCGAAISRLVTTEDSFDVASGIRWYFCGGLGAAMVALGAMGAAHRNLEPLGLTRLSSAFLHGMRVAVGVALILLPIANSKHLSSTELLGVATALTGGVVLLEVYGKLHSSAALLQASSESVAASSGTFADEDDAPLGIGEDAQLDNEEKAAAIALGDDDNTCRTWRDWIEMEKARKAERRRLARKQKFMQHYQADATVAKQNRRWRKIQRQCNTDDPVACAAVGA